MMITEEMIAKDEKRWNDRNIVVELGYCGNNIRHRKNITKDDIRFYAYIMRKAHAMLKEQEAVKPILEQDSMVCGECGHEVIWQKMLGDGIWGDEKLDYCPHCGRKVKWDD